MRNRDTTHARDKNVENKIKRVRKYNENPKLCKHCQNPLKYETHNWTEFCNSSCAASYNNRKYPKRTRSKRECKFCHKEIPWEKRHLTFCNRSCAAAYNNNGTCKIGTPHYCKQCGVKIHWKYVFCSPECRKTWEDKELVDKVRQKIEAKEYISHSTLRLYLFKTRGYKCEKCKNEVWNNLPIPLETHHKDGDYKNNEDQNLEVLCPNCHAQTDNYRIKNKGKGRPYRIPKRFMTHAGEASIGSVHQACNLGGVGSIPISGSS
jgi:hypothetical protein